MPGRPRLTWYSADGERVELSGAVLENWVNKTTNLLVEELDAGPGTRVLLDLPGHWRTVVWALATWRCGACVVLGGGEADVVVTSRPAAHAGTSAPVVAVALPALARRVDDLPPGALDAASSVSTYGDALGWVPGTEPARPAWIADGELVTHADLVLHAASRAAAPDARRVLREAVDATVALDALAVLATDASLVLADPDLAARLRTDAEARDRLVGPERVDADLLGADATGPS
ncbi:TIGR03089 family protein [Cellulomonas sp. H30R-01]|nr:TIGR03089 family protein [Cellulomonas sp. H30R-01]